jgi:hypothetical protein
MLVQKYRLITGTRTYTISNFVHAIMWNMITNKGIKHYSVIQSNVTMVYMYKFLRLYFCILLIFC